MNDKVAHFIDGRRQQSDSSDYLPVTNPASDETIAMVPCASKKELGAAVENAHAAFEKWRQVPVPERARLMLRYQALLKERQEAIAKTLCTETGKTLPDAMGEVWRGIEVVEQACNIGNAIMGERLPNVAQGVNTHNERAPLGVCVGITPFNFPAMIPLWMFPLSIAAGNSFVLKPSEQDPLTPTLLAELFIEAGAPPGLLQVVHGGKTQGEQLLEHGLVRAVSFVGSVAAAQNVYQSAAANLKRVQALGGAKNHLVVMPDAHPTETINALIGSACGAAGQRCMAISAVVFVGEAASMLPQLRDEMAKTRPGVWDDEHASYGPQISAAAKHRIETLIQTAIDEGATCELDGRDAQVEGFPNGHWVGPTLLTEVTPTMKVYREEVFGPVLVSIAVDTLDDAIALINANPNGNGTSIFTSSGSSAQRFMNHIDVGQVGINVPIPVAMPYFSFTGWKQSFYGDLHAYGREAVQFYTQAKTTTMRWFEGEEPGSPNMTIALDK